MERAGALWSAPGLDHAGRAGHGRAPAASVRWQDGCRLHYIADGSDVWVPHVSVENVEHTLAGAVGLGATLVDTADIPGLARLATLRDPEGALFGLCQPAPHQGAQLTEEVGSLWWLEVLSNDVAGAREFYGRLFGWSSVDTSFEPFGACTVFK